MRTLVSICLSAAALILPLSPPFPTNRPHGEHNEPLVRLLYQYPEDTLIENIAVRTSGELLITRRDQPHVEQFNPLGGNAEPKVVHSLDGSLSVMGIAEVASDSFAVIVGNVTFAKGEHRAAGVSGMSTSKTQMESPPKSTKSQPSLTLRSQTA
jgi:hypothetical protein